MNTKIVPYTYGLEEEMMENPSSTLIGIEEMSITYTQPADTNSRSEEIQSITITTRTAASPTKKDAEKQNCFYFDITIPEGQHWSVADGDELKALIDDFKKRIYLNTNPTTKKGNI